MASLHVHDPKGAREQDGPKDAVDIVGLSNEGEHRGVSDDRSGQDEIAEADAGRHDHNIFVVDVEVDGDYDGEEDQEESGDGEDNSSSGAPVNVNDGLSWGRWKKKKMMNKNKKEGGEETDEWRRTTQCRPGFQSHSDKRRPQESNCPV